MATDQALKKAIADLKMIIVNTIVDVSAVASQLEAKPGDRAVAKACAEKLGALQTELTAACDAVPATK